MSVSPLPAHGGVHVDARGDGRALRVSAHPELGVVTISIWRDNRCVATHQVPTAEMPGFIGLLTEALLDRSVRASAAI
ncbi:MAG TPA: hypothetical protein VFJ17_14575 [Mycobacteriales bacterium]|jgi:hypothetical protein|nr:hypothetical protein [Mycobacteriales bacterium]